MLTTNPAPSTARGLTLPCPRCGEVTASITLLLADANTCVCQECEEEFTISEVRELVSRWAKVVAWVDAMPTDE